MQAAKVHGFLSVVSIRSGVIVLFPYFWGGAPMNGVGGATFATLFDRDLGLRDLPEEVRAAIEDRKEEIHSEEDLRHIANELMMKK